MYYSFTRVSSNKKTGPIAVTRSAQSSCPSECPLKEKGCYAKYGPTGMHWRKLDNSGLSLADLVNQIRALPKDALWRHNEAGDLPQTTTGIVDGKALAKLVKANRGRNGFTYTHYTPTNPSNLNHIRAANRNGFTINLSANNLKQAVEYVKAYALPTVTILPVDAPNSQTIEGVQVVACPAEKSDKVTCSNCKLCAKSDRDYIIGFRAHGTAKKTVNLIAKG